jgi:hypothetical protein
LLFLLDSNAVSDLMRKNPRVAAQLAVLGPNDKVMICPIVRGEILYGLARLPQGHRREDLTKQAAPLFAAIACEPVPESAGDCPFRKLHLADLMRPCAARSDGAARRPRERRQPGRHG